MEHIEIYKSEDGIYFNDKDSCIRYELSIMDTPSDNEEIKFKHSMNKFFFDVMKDEIFVLTRDELRDLIDKNIKEDRFFGSR